MSAPSFTAQGGRVLLAGIEIDDQRVEDLLTFFQTQAREADKAADDARRAFNELWDARCDAVDFRQDNGLPIRREAA